MRVFVSSVMNDFATERGVAKAAIESIGLSPVMAEEFGARPYSSKSACVDGVRESDCYLAIFGDRYGWRAPSGLSVTHEEFEAARQLGLPILLVVKDPAPDREPDLTAFLQQIGDFENGYFYGKYTGEADLATAITRALTTLNRATKDGVSVGAAAKRLAPLAITETDGSMSASICVASMPATRGGSLDVRLLGSQPFRTNLGQLARYEVAVFREDLGVVAEDTVESVALVQEGNHHEHVNRVEIHVDRTIAVRLSLENRGRAERAWLEQSIIDELLVAAMLEKALRLTAEVHSKLLPKPVPSRLYIQAGIVGANGKLLGRLPSQPVHSVSWPGRGGNPVVVPKDPLLVTMAKVAEAKDLADQLREHFVRHFRATGAYFTLESRRH